MYNKNHKAIAVLFLLIKWVIVAPAANQNNNEIEKTQKASLVSGSGVKADVAVSTK